MESIKNPEQTTYFICREENTLKITTFGSVQPDQCMSTGQPILETFTKEMDWIDTLIDNGINPFPDNVEEIE